MFYIKLLACTPAEDRERMFENLGRVLEEANRLTERGEWDVEWTPPQHDEITLTDSDLTRK